VKESNYKLIKSADFPHELLGAINSSKKRIVVSVMAAYCDPATEVIFDAILRALKRGVKVEIYLDCYCKSLRSEGIVQQLKYGRKNRDYFRRYVALGAKIVWLGRVGLNPFAGRIHQKIYLVDDIAMLGGINLDFEKPKNDLMMRINSGRLVKWLTGRLGELATKGELTQQRFVVDDETTVLFDSHANSPIYDTFCQLATSAKKVRVSSRMCPSGPAMSILAGKNTKYYFNPIKFMFVTTKLAIWLDLRKYRIKNSYNGDKYLHAKVAMFDDKAVIVGSNNFNYRGVQWRTTEVAVISSDKKLVSSVSQFFASL